MKEGWELKKIKDLGNLFSGNSINKKVKEEKYTNIEGGLPYIATKDVSYDRSIDYENGIRIPEADLDLFRIAPKNTILICAEGGSAGRKIGITNQDVCIVNKLFALYTKENIEAKYVYYFYQSESFQSDFKSNLTGLIGGVSKSKFKNIEIPIPPLPEQKQIVGILDKVFAAIDQAQANIEKNIENAKELFQSKLNDIFSQKGEGWNIEFFGEVFNFRQGIQRGVKLQSEKQQEGQVRFVRIVDYTQGNELPRYIDNPGAQYILNENDISLVRYGASTGFVCRGIKGALANNLFRVIPKDDWNVNSDYLYYFLNSPVFQNFIKNKMNGAAMPAISFGMISKIPFPITAIENQIDLAQKISEVEEQTNNILDAYYQKLANLENLKKSILQKAFSGELTQKPVAV